MNHREDVWRMVDGQTFVTYATFKSLAEARVGWYLGLVLAGGEANRKAVDKWAKAQSES